MCLRLKGIKALENDEYEVILTDEKGNMERVVCCVVNHEGITMVTMQPDLVMPTRPNQPPRVESRELATAVMEYHRRHLDGLRLREPPS